jgi:SAM-dependent methyltransferase
VVALGRSHSVIKPSFGTREPSRPTENTFAKVRAMAFNQGQYWIQRHREFNNDPRSIGNLAATLEDNLTGESHWRLVASEVARMLTPGSVLDIGCGYGRITNEFIGNQHRYAGIDISPDAIARARAAHPMGEFICADISQWRSVHRYDIVLAFMCMSISLIMMLGTRSSRRR